MTAVMRWNVRIIDYLMERGVDPYVKDKFGFTAKQKAKYKQFRTIYSMLNEYESKYDNHKDKNNYMKAITNEKWDKLIKDNNIDVSKYISTQVWREDNKLFAKYMPSQVKN